ncbi:MAG TPA: T9SS type A sorting domain-containing protein [Chitinophagaceae bacterium]|nr:T9SS type A sorting domain-containing protein [Chitinophagaceae bacterium]
MKTTLHTPVNFLKAFLLIAIIASAAKVNAQHTAPELVFKNPVLESGSAGADNAAYRFSNVMPNVDALVTIIGRSSPLVSLVNIDMSNTGYTNAFQPQVSYNNANAPRYTSWWMDFNIGFVNHATTTPVAVSAFDITALDVDGDASSLHEYVSFFDAHAYTLEANSQLTVQNLLETILGLLKPGKQFNGPVSNYTDIDVTATRVMTTLNYQSKNAFTVRAGAATGSSSSSVADRMYSFWFKGFSYNEPVEVVLPVEFHSFSAILSPEKKASLRWITAMEENVSHFVVERSFDGASYTAQMLQFAAGSSQVQQSYQYTEDLSGVSPSIVYYRIKSVDIDGRYKYSDVRTIRIAGGAEKALAVQAYPNPATAQINVTVPAGWQAKKIVYELVNQAGQVVMRKEAGSGSQTETLQVSSLVKGYYVLRATCEGETAQQKIIKQ